MAKTYVGQDNSGGKVTTMPAPVASGNIIHRVYKGPTIGYAYDYSGVVTGRVLYVVINGPTLGREHSAT